MRHQHRLAGDERTGNDDLDRHGVVHNDQVELSLMLTGPPPKFQEGEHPIAASASSSAAVQVGVELAQQRRQLDTHGGLDLRRLVQVGVGEDLAQPVDVAVEVVLAAGLDEQRAQPGRGQPGHLPAGPHPELMAQAPLGFQAHGLLATLLFTLWPFTRLVHEFSAPIGYLAALHRLPQPRAAAGNASAAVSRR